MAKPFEPYDLDRLIVATDSLRDIGVRQVVFENETPVAVVDPEALIHLARATGYRPDVCKSDLECYEFTLQLGSRLRLTAMATAKHLKELGYRVITRMELVEEATPGGISDSES